MGEQASSAASTKPVQASSDIDTKHPDTAPGPTTEIERLRFDVLYSALYHDSQQLRWQRAHRILLFITILLGSSAIAAFGAQYPLLGQTSGALVATISAAQLVWDFGSRARDHHDLKRRFYALLAETECEPCDIPEIRHRMTAIYADEPPINDKVRRAAHNQAGESLFGDDFERV